MEDAMSEMIEAWYSAPRDLRVPRTGEKIEPGAIVRIEGRLELCARGLHASRNPLDALGFRLDGILTLVRLRGEIVEGSDKVCASERETVAVMDPATQDRVLRLLACTYAEWVIRWSGVEPDQRSIDAIDCARRFAWGQATREELAAALDAALDAARDAARAAAGAAAAGAAALDAARDAAWAAARDAAARDAAWDAAWAAAWDAADRDLRTALEVANG
jgi:hypothetical protein